MKNLSFLTIAFLWLFSTSIAQEPTIHYPKITPKKAINLQNQKNGSLQDTAEIAHKRSQLMDQLDILVNLYYSPYNGWSNNREFKKALARQVQSVKLIYGYETKEAEQFVLNLPLNQDGETLAHRASYNHDARCLKYLMKKKADMQATMKNGNTPYDCTHDRILDEEERANVKRVVLKKKKHSNAMYRAQRAPLTKDEFKEMQKTQLLLLKQKQYQPSVVRGIANFFRSEVIHC